MTLRINLYGNVCNNLYVVAKFLRQAGHDARLFLERGSQWTPEQEDPELRGAYPDWIEVVGDLRWRRYGILDGKFVRRLGDCDVVHVSGYGPIWAAQTGRPFVFQTYGGDLRTLPFMSDSLHHRYLARRQAQAVRRASSIVVGNVHLMAGPIKSLGLTQVKVVPLPIDASKFFPLDTAAVQDVRSKHVNRHIFFHPTRHAWTDPQASDTWKGNDRLLRAFAHYLAGGGEDAVLILIRHGPDVSASEALARSLGIESRIQWLPKLERHELATHYSAADLVFDQFAEGGYGLIALEAWSCARPVVIALEKRLDFGADQPRAINAATEDEILQSMLDYTRSPDVYRRLGIEARDWILRHHHGDALTRRYLDIYSDLLTRSPAL